MTKAKTLLIATVTSMLFSAWVAEKLSPTISIIAAIITAMLAVATIFFSFREIDRRQQVLNTVGVLALVALLIYAVTVMGHV